jgi:probable phosphoglycerate mutase
VTRLVLIRHGQAQVFLDQIVAGHDTCTGLSELGRMQAELLRTRLERTGELSDAVALYASRMRRAEETAECVAPALGGLAIRIECDLCEMHPGTGEGLTWAQWGERFGESDPFNPENRSGMAPDGGESIDMFVGRVGGALKRVADEHVGETIVIACHGGVIRSSFEALGGVPWGSLLYYAENTSLTEWRRDDDSGAWHLVRFNDAAHLDGSC